MRARSPAPDPPPLTPADVNALLLPDPRSRAADLLALRDALAHMAGALDELARAIAAAGAAGAAGAASTTDEQADGGGA